MSEHELELIEQNPYAPLGQGVWTALCSCRNPDGEGVGEVAFYGDTRDEALQGFKEHLAEISKSEASTRQETN